MSALPRTLCCFTGRPGSGGKTARMVILAPIRLAKATPCWTAFPASSDPSVGSGYGYTSPFLDHYLLAGHRSPPQLNLPALANRGMRLCGSFKAQTRTTIISAAESHRGQHEP